MTTDQFVILARNQRDGAELTPIGSRQEILRALARFNTMPEREGEDLVYGPGICLQLPPGADPVRQILMSINEEEIAWQVIARLMKALDWKLLDPSTGRELGGNDVTEPPT